MRKLIRFYHTVRYLKAIQILARVLSPVIGRRVDAVAGPPRTRLGEGWQTCDRAPSLFGPASFEFMGMAGEVSAKADWNRSTDDALWTYNLHYFDDLIADGSSRRRTWHVDLIQRWIEENPMGEGRGWDAYPTSLRIVNWIKWASGGGELGDCALTSLASQCRWLSRRLEFHLLGNHLWANCKALIFGGGFFDSGESENWWARGLRLIDRELREQILPDGGHFERSPMYHAIILEDLIDLLQLDDRLGGKVPPDTRSQWIDAVGRMGSWLCAMAHPDGEVGHFNDTALGAGPTAGQLEDYAQRVGLDRFSRPVPGLAPLPDSGYVRLERDLAVVLCDVGEIGPDYLPGHAHADTLSFECSLAGRRLLVNGGTSTYERNNQRMAERGTAYHNTIEVDGVDSSEVWASFRVARRARPLSVGWREQGGRLRLEAAHDGYLRLPGKVIHRRRWELSERSLRVSDTLSGQPRSAVARFRLAPGLDYRLEGSAQGEITGHDLSVRWRVKGGGSPRIVDGSYHPGFNLTLPCRVLECPFEHSLQFELGWS